MASELRVDRIIPVNGVPTGGGGGIVQVVTEQILTSASAANIPYDNTTPTITEGFEIVNLSITPLSTSNKIILGASFMIDYYLGAVGIGCMFRDSTLLNVTHGNASKQNLTLFYVDTPNTLNSITYSVRAGTDSGTAWVHSENGGPKFGGNNTYLSNYFWAMEVSG
jgi:hypothetical protein